jgi:hypothetical protein
MIKNSQVVHINSKFRLSGTDENFTATINLQPMNKFTHVVVMSALIPKSYYVVQDGANQFLIREVYQNETLEYIITIPIGNYSITSFKTVVEGLFLAQGIDYVVTYANSKFEAVTGKLKFTHISTGNHQAYFVFYDNDLCNIFGFDRNSVNEFVDIEGIDYVLYSKNVVNFQQEPSLFIHSDVCYTYNNDVLLEIYTTNNPQLSNVVYENIGELESHSKRVRNSNNNTYNFKLTNEYGDIIGLNGVNLLLSLLFYEKYEFYDMIKNFINFSMVAIDNEKKYIEDEKNKKNK